MADVTLASVVASAASSLAASMISSSALRIKSHLGDKARRLALEESCSAGLVALLATARTAEPMYRDHIHSAFLKAFRHERVSRDVGTELRECLRGEPLYIDGVLEIFERYGHDLRKLPGLDAVQGLQQFETAFVATAMEQSALQGGILTFHAQEQTKLLREVVEEVRNISSELRGFARSGVDAFLRSPPVVQVLEVKIDQRVSVDQHVTVSQAPDPAIQDARRRYLEKLVTICEELPLAQLGGQGKDHGGVELKDVFVALQTKSRVPLTDSEKEVWKQQRRRRPAPEDRILPAEEAADTEPRLVLLGDPGSGKSSFVRQRAARMAASLLEAEADGSKSEVLPILLTLRDVAVQLATVQRPDFDDKSTKQKRLVLMEVFKKSLASLAKDCEAEAFQGPLTDALIDGRCLLILDGLDEVPASLRQLIRECVDVVLRRFKVSRIIVTCRVRSYEGDAVLPGFAVHELAPFTEGQVQDFISAWYQAQFEHGHLTSEKAEERTGDLQKAVRAKELKELAENPMLLTTMALIHQQNVGLPRQRVRLYDEAVEVLLVRWQAHKGSESEERFAELREILKDKSRIRPILERLAFEVHLSEQKVGERGDSNAEAGFERGRLVTLLEKPEYLGSLAMVETFLDYVDQRAGILLGRGGGANESLRYTFPHRTFQEYLVGCHLAGKPDPVAAIYERAAQGDFWYLAVQLAAEELVYSRRMAYVVERLARNLLAEGEEDGEQGDRAALWAAAMAVLLEAQPGGVGEAGARNWAKFLPACREKLVALLGDGLPVRERAEAGRLLAKLGDPRPEIMTIEAMEFCYVPAGPFWMGSDDEDKLAFGDEKPITRQELNYDYWMARYPVTQAQFRLFVEAGGYQEGRYWPEAQAAERWTAETGFDDRQEPVLFGEPFDLANHPVVGVSWFEALAFTRWLTVEYRERGWLPDGWSVALPSELEWEKAARGGEEVPASVLGSRISILGSRIEAFPGRRTAKVDLLENEESRRMFPWLGGFDSGRLNSSKQRLGGPSTPGIFSTGRSPVGCDDLVGNVWEWTRSRSADYPYPAEQEGRREREELSNVEGFRVCRGGSFFFSLRNVRCAFRDGWPPSIRDGNTGFRVALLPSALISDPSDL